jgi:alpha-tubulin suppressor-like RCC1 family protein
MRELHLPWVLVAFACGACGSRSELVAVLPVSDAGTSSVLNPLDGGLSIADAEASDASDDATTCTNPCEPGATSCTGNEVQMCQPQAGGCPLWIASGACGPHQMCVAAGSGAACVCDPASCSSGISACADQDDLATCATDSNGCSYAEATSTCPFSCADAACTTPAAIAAGGYHSCAVVSGGGIVCWGQQVAPLPDGGIASSLRPAPVTMPAKATAVVAGNTHNCARLADATVACWGSNDEGQLGTGTEQDENTPVVVPGLNGVIAIAAGWNMTCVILAGGAVDCWGSGVANDLVNVPMVSSPTPLGVPGLVSATAIDTSGDHACAILSDGTVRCWGDNSYGQLGDGTTNGSTTPVAVQGLSSAKAISTGWSHTCALLNDGTAACWGLTQYGELGSGVPPWDGGYSYTATPSPVDVLAGAKVVAAHDAYTCAILVDSSVSCWGGSAMPLAEGAPTTIPGLSGASALATSDTFVCALLPGSVECWGDNTYGELGNGTTQSSDTPVVVQ